MANDIELVHDEKVPILLSKNSEIREAIMRIAKTNTILELPLNKLVTVENTYHDTNHTDNAKERKLRREAVIFGEQKRKYKC